VKRSHERGPVERGRRGAEVDDRVPPARRRRGDVDRSAAVGDRARSGDRGDVELEGHEGGGEVGVVEDEHDRPWRERTERGRDEPEGRGVEARGCQAVLEEGDPFDHLAADPVELLAELVADGPVDLGDALGGQSRLAGVAVALAGEVGGVPLEHVEALVEVGPLGGPWAEPGLEEPGRGAQPPTGPAQPGEGRAPSPSRGAHATRR
jgi:hypothetical protein